MATTINRADIGVDDNGTAQTGTVVNTAYIALAIYDKVDAILAGNIITGGTLTTGGLIDCPASVRATGSVTPATGTGAELLTVAGVGTLQAYNRTGSVYVQLNIDGLTTLINGVSGGNVGFGMTTAPGAFVEIRKTTAQLRLSFDGSNRCTVTVGSTGITTFALAGTTPNFTFNQWVDVGAVIRSTGSTTPSGTGGAAIELIFVAGTTGTVQSYNRTTSVYLATNIEGNPLTLNSGAQQGVIISAATGGNKGNNTLNCNTYYGAGVLGVSATFSGTLTGLVATGGIVTTLTSSSDQRLKTDLGRFEYGLDAIKRLRPHRFNWNEHTQGEGRTNLSMTQENVGLFAQELEEVMPEAVGEETWADGSTWKTTDERRVLMALINAVKELGEENSELRDRLQRHGLA
jgi:hypothetical protein